MNIIIKNNIGILTGILMLSLSQNASAQANKLAAEDLQRAEKIYADIWLRYRVPKYDGLFSENYPSSKKDSVNYFQGSAVKEKEVSFLWPFSGVVSATNALLKIPGKGKKYKPYLDSLMTGMEAYRDTTRSPVGYQAYPARFEKDDRYYDDNGLVGVEYMEAYFNTKNPVYLSRAKTVFKFILSGWSDELGGGIYWLEGHHDQKPACSNGMALLVALKLYQATNDTYYLDWGKRFYNFMHTNLRNPDGVYYNDIKTKDGSLGKVYWTYNSGSVLEAAVLLYHFTKDKQYLAEAQQIAKGVSNQFGGEKHDAHLTMRIDLPWFVAVLFRGYEALYKVDGNYTYIAALHKDLDYAWDNTQDQYGFLSHSWTVNADEIKKPKWLLDEACIAELYARLSLLESEKIDK